MAATLADIRDGIADLLSDVPGLSVYRTPAENFDPPAAMVMGFRIVPQTFDGLQTVSTEVRVVVSRRHVDQLDLLDALVDPNVPDGIFAAIAADPTLGGRVHSTIVETVGDYGEFVVGDLGHYGCAVNLEVLL